MRFFHVMLHARPALPCPVEPAPWEGRELTRVVVGPEQLQQPLAVTFEEAADRLGTLSRLFFEPDGSFVWVGQSTGGGAAWQIDGLLLDGGRALQYVELKGMCAAATWDELLRALAAEPEELLVQLVAAGYFLTAAEFRRFQFTD